MLARLLIIAVFCYQDVFGSKQLLCNFNNSNCLTEGAQNTFQEFIHGDLRGLTSSDTLHAELIKGDLPNLKYNLYNTVFEGMGTCTPELVDINANLQTYEYRVACKHLIMNGTYDAKGIIDGKKIDGNGDYGVDIFDYLFIFKGDIDAQFDESEKLHVLAKTFNLDIEARGNIVYNFKNLCNGDEVKSAETLKYFNDNWKEIDKLVRGPAMKHFMTIFIHNVNSYLSAVPVEHVFPNNS